MVDENIRLHHEWTLGKPKSEASFAASDGSATPREYKVIEARTAAYLESAVERMMRQGWAAHGAVSIRYEPPENTRSTGVTYSQAMIR